MIPNRRSAQQKVADFSDKVMLQTKSPIALWETAPNSLQIE
jgi:hypothetical protein